MSNRKGMCGERSGFLFSHDCDRMAAGQCSACNKEICAEHTFAGNEGLLCTSCAKRQRAAAKREGRDMVGGERRRDPYFYPGTYYRGWGYYGHGHWGHHHHSHDANDLTEGDGEALAADGDEDFEQDMGGS